jgi:hypothetical protein
VLDEKHPIIAVDHDAANPERHATGEAPIQMETPPQQRLESSSQGLKFHRGQIPVFPQIVLILASRRPACHYLPRDRIS